MKRFIAISAIVISALGILSCEQHSWEDETKRLYKSSDSAKDAKKDAPAEEAK